MVFRQAECLACLGMKDVRLCQPVIWLADLSTLEDALYRTLPWESSSFSRGVLYRTPSCGTATLLSDTPERRGRRADKPGQLIYKRACFLCFLFSGGRNFCPFGNSRKGNRPRARLRWLEEMKRSDRNGSEIKDV